MDAKDEIKNRLDVADVVGEYVKLKRAGRNFKGLSPWTNEKTPSFMVSPEKQIWHDFSSGKGGDVFSFIMDVEGLDFRGALELLARKAGVDLDDHSSKPSNTKLKQRLLEINEKAAKFYQVQLKNSQTALDYVLNKRRLTKKSALDFRLGYAPNTGDALAKFLKKLSVTDDEMKKSGLMARTARAGDMFRGRLMIPLMDAQGAVIGFTARSLEDEPNSPKYINTPQTLLYDKSRHVYGLHLAKESIRKDKYSVVVEGNLDVIASHQAGVNNVVATAGTALTEDHLKTIGRFSDDVRLCFDADKAGINATERSIPLASKVGVSLSIVTLPEDKDPDDIIRQNARSWKTLIAKKDYAMDWLIKHYSQDLDLESGQGKRAFSDALLPTLRGITDPVEIDHYLTLVAKKMQASPAALRDKLQASKAQGNLKRRSPKAIEQDKHQLEWAKAQDHFLSLVLMRPKLRDLLELVDDDMLIQDSAKQLLDYLQAHPDFDGDLKKAPLLQSIGDYVKIVSLQYEALFVSLDAVEGRYEATRLRARLIELYVKTKKARLSEALQSADDESTHKLLTRVKSLDNLLKQAQIKGK